MKVAAVSRTGVWSTAIAESTKSLPGRCGSAGSATALRDSLFAATHGLTDLEAFELRMVEVERLVLAGVPMGKTECFRLGPVMARGF